MMRRILWLFFIFVFISCLWAFADEYIIGPDDVLDITVWKDDALTKVLTVDKEGNITLPYINKVKVAGLTPKEAAEFIANRLKAENYLVDPQVTVSVKEYRGQKVMVFGLVKKPGVYYLKGKTLVLDLLSQIESTEGTGGKMEIMRKTTSGEEETINVDLYALIMNGDLSQNVQILPGDNIIISRKTPAPEPYLLNEEYVIAADDVLDITVWKDDALTKVLTVDKEGNITLSYINKVKVSGLTPKEAAEFITNKLKAENYLVDPQVIVSVKEYRGQKVMVFGLVKKPGVHYLKGKTLVLDLLSQIESTEGTSGKMEIMRKTPSGEEETINVDLYALLMNGDLSQNVQILPGDNIIVSRKSTEQQIYILGEVRTPGPYTIERDLSVLEALRMAGGFTDFANKSKAKIIREENGRKKTIIVNLDKVRKGDKSQDFTLSAGDVLVALKSWF